MARQYTHTAFDRKRLKETHRVKEEVIRPELGLEVLETQIRTFKKAYECCDIEWDSYRGTAYLVGFEEYTQDEKEEFARLRSEAEAKKAAAKKKRAATMAEKKRKALLEEKETLIKLVEKHKDLAKQLVRDT